MRVPSCAPSIRPPRIGVIGAAVCATLGCTTATFVPANVRRIEGEGASARLESARLSTDGRLWVRTRFAGAAGTRVHDARLVPAREPACARVGTLAHAGELLHQGAVRWDRPLPVEPESSLEVAFDNYGRAFDGPAALELDVGAHAEAACLRLPLSGQADGPWQPVPLAAALGLRIYADLASTSLLLRPGILTRSFRHGLELGIGSGNRDELVGGPVLAFGASTERILWSFQPGLLSVSAEVAYQARLAFEAPAAGHTRLIHGPRIGLRPLVFTAPNPRLLHIGPRFGSLAPVELFFAFWMTPDASDHRATLGIAFSFDSPLPH